MAVPLRQDEHPAARSLIGRPSGSVGAGQDGGDLPGGADKGGVLLRGDLPLLRRVGLVLDAQTAHTAVLPVEQAQKAVQRGQDGVDTVGGVVLC